MRETIAAKLVTLINQRHQLNEQIQQLTIERDQAIANRQAHDGAIEFAKSLLAAEGPASPVVDAEVISPPKE